MVIKTSSQPNVKLVTSSARPSILVADDDPSVCRIIHRMLSPANYEVQFSQTIAGAVQAIDKKTFDLYLLDYKLPDGSGLDIAESIRAKGLSTPIIMITGYQRETGLRAQNMGIFVIIEKPFSTQTICTAVRKALHLPETDNAKRDLSTVGLESVNQPAPNIIFSPRKRYFRAALAALIGGTLLLLGFCSIAIYLHIHLTY
jgi:DNA-binding NtrC family response regulator